MDFVFPELPPLETPLRAAVRDAHRLDEAEADRRILAAAELPPEARDRIAATARGLVEAVRRERLGKGGLDAFLHEYALSSPEGIALMCLAEALLRIPDDETAHCVAWNAPRR
jgi:RHH-type proline utilization regulon transcriptional repressor/proline dehydrogenase/delta 1-pyrroline-5-carboxylate dehydrogenase